MGLMFKRVKVGKKMYWASSTHLHMVFVTSHSRKSRRGGRSKIGGFWKSLPEPITYCDEFAKEV
jgi:hypothetical protein